MDRCLCRGREAEKRGRVKGLEIVGAALELLKRFCRQSRGEVGASRRGKCAGKTRGTFETAVERKSESVGLKGKLTNGRVSNRKKRTHGTAAQMIFGETRGSREYHGNVDN